MPRRIAQTTLNASTIDILNVIRANASYDYQQSVPAITQASEVPKVGEVIYGTPAFANQFLNSLVNRIASVRVQSATFNNPYARLKKGYLEFGETIEDIFVNIAKVVEYSAEKAADREFKRTIPDVRSVFHTMNYRAMYPVTIQDEDLRLAFLSVDGVTDLVSKIVEQVYTAAEYDEFLLCKYLIIKACSHGKMKPMSVAGDIKVAAKAFRGTSNLLPFMGSDYNEAGVKTTTPKSRQVIFMDAAYNAEYDVDVLSAAFNMDKADYEGALYLIDNFTTFDNDRFEVIRANSDGIEEVTSEELALMADVKAILMDENWFQLYDNNNKFTEKYVASGMYWNYFYHTWKTVSYSPFANAVVFVGTASNAALPSTLTVEITGKDISDVATVFTLGVQDDDATLKSTGVNFEQTEVLTQNGIAIQRFGAVIIPATKAATEITLVVSIGDKTYTAATTISAAQNVGATVTLELDE